MSESFLIAANDQRTSQSNVHIEIRASGGRVIMVFGFDDEDGATVVELAPDKAITMARGLERAAADAAKENPGAGEPGRGK